MSVALRDCVGRLFQWIKIVLHQIVEGIDQLPGIGVVPVYVQGHIQHVAIRGRRSIVFAYASVVVLHEPA